LYDDTTGIATPESFNYLQALRIVGYDIRDTTAAIRAFKQHFVQDTLSRIMNDSDKKVLYTLSKKFM
jgi:N-acetylmuramoyl-L-alanine amidase